MPERLKIGVKMENNKLHIREFTIGCTHTINLGNYSNIKVEASLTCGIKVGYTEEELYMAIQEAQGRLRQLLEETYRAQKRQKASVDELSR